MKFRGNHLQNFLKINVMKILENVLENEEIGF